MKNGDISLNCGHVDRVAWIDIAKGYGILSIMAGHVGIGKAGLLLYSFHVPLFFFLSGYVFKIGGDFVALSEKR